MEMNDNAGLGGMNLRIIDNLKGKVESLSFAEAEEIATLIRGNTEDVNRGEYSPDQLERIYSFATPESIQQKVDRGALIMLSTDEGEITGCGMVMQRGLRPVIKTIQVKMGYQRKGYGALIYKHCEQRFKEANFREIEVEVTKFPGSEAFYRKMGFVKTGNPTPLDLYFAMFKYI